MQGTLIALGERPGEKSQVLERKCLASEMEGSRWKEIKEGTVYGGPVRAASQLQI